MTEKDEYLKVLETLDAVTADRPLTAEEAGKTIRTIALLKYELDEMTARNESCGELLRHAMSEVERLRSNYAQLMQDPGVVKAVTSFAVGQYTRNRFRDE